MATVGRVKRARVAESAAKIVLGAMALAAVGSGLFIVAYIVARGLPHISWQFLTTRPGPGFTSGGIQPVIIGTVQLVFYTALFAVPLGVLAGVYLAEYAPRGAVTRAIRLSIANMAGVPSIVYGLFGMALFVLALGFGRSVLAGALTLACLTLPVVITATEEALRQVPRDLRHASLALGASRLRTTVRVVLPAAAPGIITGTVLGLSRAAGETAPILTTAVAFLAPVASSPLDKTMALPYHIYIMATQAVNKNDAMVWGSAFVLVVGVSALNVIVAVWRSHRRRSVRW